MLAMYYNPYHNKTFIGFILEVFARIWQFLSGKLAFDDLVTDEIQIIVLVGVAASSALMGCFLILRKMTMLANALSHTLLLGIVFVYLFFNHSSSNEHYQGTLNIPAMLVASVFTGILTTFLTQFLTKTVRLQEDASTGLVFTSLFALGVVLVTMFTRSSHIGTEAVMGNVDALHKDDCRLVFWVLGINLVLIFLFYKEYLITTFDSGISQALGISTLFFDYLLMVQVSTTAIGAFRAVGVLMVLAFITGPCLTARMLTHSLKKMIILSVLIGSLASFVGVALARHLLSFYGIALSTAGLVVCFIVIFYLLVILGVKLKNRQRFSIRE